MTNSSIAASVENLLSGDFTETSRIIYRATSIEKMLERMIEHRMVPLTGKLRSKIFTGYGPLSSFSAKTDIAYALGLISHEQKQTVDHIRQIRNVFAHADDLIHYNHKTFREDARLANNPLRHSEQALHEATMKLLMAFIPTLQTGMLAKAVRDTAAAMRPK